MLLPEMSQSIWRFDKVVWRKMMVYALPLMLAGLAGITNETIDRILLKPLTTDISSPGNGLYLLFISYHYHDTLGKPSVLLPSPFSFSRKNATPNRFMLRL